MSGQSNPTKPKSVVRVAYDAYRDYLMWEQHQETPPEWIELTNLEQEAWETAVLEIFDEIKNRIEAENEEE